MAKKCEMVAMCRDPAIYSKPHSAMVHPDEVANYAAGGWVVGDAPPAAPVVKPVAENNGWGSVGE